MLRTARQMTAARLGTELDRVRPETPLEAGGREVLEALYDQVLDILSRERSLDPHRNLGSDIPTPSLEDLGLTLGREASAPTVAEVASLATRAAVRLLLGHRLDVPAEELASELHFALDLDADSLTRVDLVLLLEEALDVSVPDDSMSLVQTVGDAELFSVLFDRTREEIILALGRDIADDLSLDTPLADFGDGDGQVAIASAARAVGSELPQCRCPCHSLKDAVRLAFLADKVRTAFASGSGVAVASITAATVPDRDLGLSPDQAHKLFSELALSLDVDPAVLQGGHDRPLGVAVRRLADASVEATGGGPR